MSIAQYKYLGSSSKYLEAIILHEEASKEGVSLQVEKNLESNLRS